VEQHPELSVIICSLDRREDLCLTLASLQQQRAEGDWEVLVVDNGSADGSPEAAAAMEAGFQVPFRLETEPRRGLSFGRNTALELARGESVLFLDDDVNCLPGLVDGHLQAFRSPEVVATAGRILPLMPPETPPWFYELLEDEVGGPTSRYDFGDRGGEIPVVEGQPHPFGANMGMRRERALDCGGFRTDLGWGKKMIPCEETEFFRRYGESAGGFRYVPESAVEHRIPSHRVSWEYFLRWNIGYGRAAALMDGPTGFLARVAATGRHLLRSGRMGRRARRYQRLGQEGKMRLALKKRARSRGSMLQLLGL